MRQIRKRSLNFRFKQSKSNLCSFTRLESELGDEFGGEMEVIREGEAEILLDSNNRVFYNRAQIHNRDLSIAVLRTFISKRKEGHNTMLSKKVKGELESLRVLEALSASGLRSIRYALEVDGIDRVVALDNDAESVEACKKNIQFNGSVASSKVEVHLGDARVYMLTHPKEFEAVDLDPYGSPSIFLDSALQSVSDGGLLMCSATDLAVLCGHNREVCYSRYGSYPLKGKYCHEMALRILLATIESHANRYKRFIVPVLSVYMDYYIRVFVRIFTSASEMKNVPLKLSYVYQCGGCDSYHLQSLGRSIAKNNRVRYGPGLGPVVPKECCDCGKSFNMGGPIWSAPIHDQEWVASILADAESMKQRYPAYEKLSSVLRAISEELPDVPLFVSLHNLCGTLKCTTPPARVFHSAVTNAGYRISGTHTTPLGLKTDAPMTVIWDIMRCWVKNHPVKALQPDQAGAIILSKEPNLQASFLQGVDSLGKAQAKKEGARFLPNPERHWGPNMRAGRPVTIKNASQLCPKRASVPRRCEEGNKES